MKCWAEYAHVKYSKAQSNTSITFHCFSSSNIDIFTEVHSWIKLMKGKALGKHSLHEKKAASVLLKLFISGNEGSHTTDAS